MRNGFFIGLLAVLIFTNLLAEVQGAPCNDHGEDAADYGHGSHDQRLSGEICPEHNVPEETDALCHGDHLAGLSPGDGMLFRLAHRDAGRRAGVTTAFPTQIPHADSEAFPARLEFNRNRTAQITALAPGVIRQVLVQPGDRVRQGAPLVEIAMPEIAALRTQLATARTHTVRTAANFEREKDLLSRGITSRQAFEIARADHQAALGAVAQFATQLRSYGEDPDMPPSTGPDTRERVILRAPFGGTVIRLATGPGETAGAHAPLLTVSDLDILWAAVSVPTRQLHRAQPDKPVIAQFQGLPEQHFEGRIFQPGAEVDPRTNTLTVWVELKNPDHLLRAGMFGQVTITNGTRSLVWAVPRDAIQTIDGHTYLFVQKAPDLFEVRRVATGKTGNGPVPVLAGISDNDRIVVRQGFSMKSELLKGRLGASCADH